MENLKEVKQPTPMQAIRQKCLDCMCGSTKEVRLCNMVQCSLHRFRMGHNPSRSKGKAQAALAPA